MRLCCTHLIGSDGFRSAAGREVALRRGGTSALGSFGAYASLVTSTAMILFDLDGTLIDGGPGQLASLAHACRAVDVPVPDEATLRSFIGPPFDEGLGAHFGLDEHQRARAVAAYRERYVDGGAMLEAVLHPGLAALLDDLRETGYLLGVATSKPTPYATRILERLGVLDRFAGVFGADLAGARARKEDVVGESLFVLDVPPGATVLVGDTEYDVYGAHAHGVFCVGVLWGIGSRAELEAAGADAIVAAPCEVSSALPG
jgi:phosphoglycolate phosphatase